MWPYFDAGSYGMNNMAFGNSTFGGGGFGSPYGGYNAGSMGFPSFGSWGFPGYDTMQYQPQTLTRQDKKGIRTAHKASKAATAQQQPATGGPGTGLVPGSQYAPEGQQRTGGIDPVNGWGGYDYFKGPGGQGQPLFSMSYGHRLYDTGGNGQVFESDTPGVYKQQGTNQMMTGSGGAPGREVLQNFYGIGQDPNLKYRGGRWA